MNFHFPDTEQIFKYSLAHLSLLDFGGEILNISSKCCYYYNRHLYKQHQ